MYSVNCLPAALRASRRQTFSSRCACLSRGRCGARLTTCSPPATCTRNGRRKRSRSHVGAAAIRSPHDCRSAARTDVRAFRYRPEMSPIPTRYASSTESLQFQAPPLGMPPDDTKSIGSSSSCLSFGRAYIGHVSRFGRHAAGEHLLGVAQCCASTRDRFRSRRRAAPVADPYSGCGGCR